MRPAWRHSLLISCSFPRLSVLTPYYAGLHLLMPPVVIYRLVYRWKFNLSACQHLTLIWKSTYCTILCCSQTRKNTKVSLSLLFFLFIHVKPLWVWEMFEFCHVPQQLLIRCSGLHYLFLCWLMITVKPIRKQHGQMERTRWSWLLRMQNDSWFQHH